MRTPLYECFSYHSLSIVNLLVDPIFLHRNNSANIIQAIQISRVVSRNNSTPAYFEFGKNLVQAEFISFGILSSQLHESIENVRKKKIGPLPDLLVNLGLFLEWICNLDAYLTQPSNPFIKEQICAVLPLRSEHLDH